MNTRPAAILFALLSLLFVAGCATTARTTTQEERANAELNLTLVETAVIALAKAGAIKPEVVDKASITITELRKIVKESETVPISIDALTIRIAALVTAWLPDKAEKKQPQGG